MNPKFAAGAFIIRPQSAEGITNSLSLSVKLVYFEIIYEYLFVGSIDFVLIFVIASYCFQT